MKKNGSGKIITERVFSYHNNSMPTILKTYNQLVVAIEKDMRRLESVHSGALQCRPSCDHCCAPFSLLPIEAAIVRKAHEKLHAESKSIVSRQARDQNAQCPFLIQSTCSIYPSRPIICRTHGLPIAYIDEEKEAIEVSACPINFPDHALFEREGLLFMDPFNAKLAEINYDFARSRGIVATARMTLHEIILGPNKGIILR